MDVTNAPPALICVRTTRVSPEAIGANVEVGFGESDVHTPGASQKRPYIKGSFGDLGTWFL